MSSPLNIVLCLDKNYAHYAAVTTYSAFVNSQSELRLFWIVPDKDEPEIAPMVEHLERRFGLKVCLVPASLDELAGWKVSDYISLGTYLRLLIPALIPEPRVIYLDADTLVLSDLNALYSTDLGDHLIAGVADVPGGNPSRVPRHGDDPYINAGVLLMDLAALREDRMLEKAKDIYFEYANDIVWHDQCIINKYAEGRKLVLPSGWNRQIPPAAVTENEFKAVLQERDLAVLHFIGPIKPWQKWCNPFVGKFWLSHAERVGIDGLKVQEVTTLEQVDLLVQMLETDGHMLEASRLKDKIIAELVELLHASNYKSDLGKHVLKHSAWQ
jgi:lipopolysaccharide biosynthesis glycosyltransferase